MNNNNNNYNNNNMNISNISNVDKKFNQEMCFDMEMSQERVGTSVSTINTRNILFSPDHHTEYPVLDMPEEFRIDTKPFVNRPFFVESVSWSNQAKYALLSNNTKELPKDVFTSNKSLEMALKLGAYFRSDLYLNVSVAGTIGHAGVVLVGILPPFPDNFASSAFLVNTLMSGPHCFLNANEATSCVLHVPWYCNSDLDSLDFTNTAVSTTVTTTNAVHNTASAANSATLVMMVLNPLAISTGASTSLQITVEACFSALDIFVPSPKFVTYVTQGGDLKSIATGAIDKTTSLVKSVVGDAIDAVREGIRYYTGLHNPNVPLIKDRMIVTRRNFGNYTTSPQFFEKMDPFPDVDRIVDRPLFNTSVDEMSIKHIISKPQFLGTIAIDTNNPTGKLLWSRPISPFQGGLATAGAMVKCANNIELMHYVSRAWRGSINIHIQSVMNNKQQIKVRLLQLYNPSREIIAGKVPTYADILSAPSHLLEFTAGGEIQTVTLPYLSRNSLTPCSVEMQTEGLFHGMYYLYVAQPLVCSSDSPTSIALNMYMSLGDDFSFHGYATEPCVVYPFVPTVVKAVDDKNKTTNSIFQFCDQKVKKKTDEVSQSKVKEVEVDFFGDPVPVVGDQQNKNEVKREVKNGVYKDLAKDRDFVAAFAPPIVPVNQQFSAQGIDVMNQPQDDTTLISSNNSINYSPLNQERLYSPIDIRPLIRRMYQGEGATVPAGINRVDLAQLIGERLLSTGDYTPLHLITHMYYGKHLGLKLKLVCRGDVSSTTVSNTMSIHFVPPQVNVDQSNGSIRRCNIAPSTRFSPQPTTTSTSCGYPLPFIETCAETSENVSIYEFVIPNTSLYKFIGGPEKYAEGSNSLAISDIGQLILFTKVSTQVTIYFSFTDESRLGFHTIAPTFSPCIIPTTTNKATVYTGRTGDTILTSISALLNAGMYYTKST